LSWRPFVVFVCFLGSVAFTGCSSLGASRPAAPQPRRDLLTRDEILSSTAHQSDLLQAIRSLRPEFLAPPRSRTTGRGEAVTPLMVYVEGVRQAGTESLRNIAASQILEVQYLDPTASASQFGPTAGGGALVIRVFHNDRSPLDG
jgi:hypothetical protein